MYLLHSEEKRADMAVAGQKRVGVKSITQTDKTTHHYFTNLLQCLLLEGCGFTGFQVFTGSRYSRFEKLVRSKKNEKPVFTGDITTNTMLPELEASSMAESQEKFVVNLKGKAPIWEFFRFRCKDGQVDCTKAYCTECKASVKLGGGTSNMSAHVRRHHPLLLNKPFGKAKVTSVRNPHGGKNTLRI